MASMLRKGMSWLGLGPEEHFDEYYEDEYYEDDIEYADEYDEPEVAPAPHRRGGAAAAHVEDDWGEPEASGITVLPSASPSMVPRQSGVQVDTSRGVVRPLPALGNTRPRVVIPAEFNDAQEVGDWFKKGRPVVLNLQGLERDLARRLLDFTSGVAYGLSGRVEKLASHVYLLSPSDVEVSEADRRRIREGDFSNEDE